VIAVGAPEKPRLQLARKFGAEATVNIKEFRDERVKRVRDIVGGFGADLVMDCSGRPARLEGAKRVRRRECPLVAVVKQTRSSRHEKHLRQRQADASMRIGGGSIWAGIARNYGQPVCRSRATAEGGRP
jgi:threonine dehydrogenase-like Zn-dependent dehydrogenase